MGPTSSHHNKNSCKSTPGARLLAIFLCAMPWVVLAANGKPVAPSLEDARWFQVELILFAQNRGEPLESEKWPDIEGLTLPDALLELHLPTSGSSANEADITLEPSRLDEPAQPDATDPEPPADIAVEDDGLELPIAYQMLSDDVWQLKGVAEKLRSSSRYTTLLHIAWQQPTLDRQHAQPIFFMQSMEEPLPVMAMDEAIDKTPEDDTPAFNAALLEPTSATKTELPALLEYATEADAAIGPPNPKFAGTVTLSVERYLHFAADLVYRQPVTQRTAIPIPDLDLWYDRPYPTLSEPQGPAYRLDSWQAMRGFRLIESRRMRSKVIHYLDNPFMGLVVVITPVELPEPAEEIQQTSPQNILSTPGKR